MRSVWRPCHNSFMTTTQRTKWEYSQLTHGVTLAADHRLTFDVAANGGDVDLGRDGEVDVVGVLTQLGAEGWELVGVDTKHHLADLEPNRWSNTVYTLKRQARASGKPGRARS